MMPVMAIALVPVILALGGVGLVLLLVWGPVRERLALQDLKASCAALRARLGVLRTQGGSVDEAAKLEAQLDDCQEALRAAGIDIDEFGELVRQIEDTRRQMQQEFSHLRSTDYADILKRGNIRGTILRLGEDIARVYDAAIAVVQSEPEAAIQIPQLQTLLTNVHKDLADSSARRACYRSGSGGCGRYLGSTEDAGDSKVEAEMSRIRMPLKGIEVSLLEQLTELSGEAPAGPEGVGRSRGGSVGTR